MTSLAMWKHYAVFWGLTNFALDSGILQQKSFMQSPQQFQHLQFLTPQQQHQLLLQAQQTMTSLTASDVETRRLRMLLNNRNMSLGRDGQINNGGDTIPNIRFSDQFGGSRIDVDMLIKENCPFTIVATARS
ncbi:hypothetical protein GUJ93_ZPchr0001g30161 [Zizania palustris]|uniref:Uncharacterized protein n=1 Tax=Zizania palustris TaxID=103762 RepID=A0A8J5V567_ZIZPA|nr:hypothetical protein GUJ93_ZPchr0001g30161 [Zizania palustris]